MFSRHIKIDALEAENEQLREDLHHIQTRAAEITEDNQQLKEEVLFLQRGIEQTEVEMRDELERMRWNVRNTIKQLMDFKRIVEDIGVKIDMETQALGAACLR